MKPRFKVGDKVKTDYHWNQRDIVRRITSIVREKSFGSGYAASVDGGETCPTCGSMKGVAIIYVNSTWFKKIEDGE
jgi:hypothetical protein